MGIYHIIIGKGILMPYWRFIQLHLLTQVDEHTTPKELDAAIDKFLKKSGPDYELIHLGHDAFEGDGYRNFVISNLFEDEQSKIIIENEKLQKEKPDFSHYPDDAFLDQLVFIGKFHTLSPAGDDFSSRPKAPELIYGLATLLPKLVNCYMALQKGDYKNLEETFTQTAHIWTFASDCACCT